MRKILERIGRSGVAALFAIAVAFPSTAVAQTAQPQPTFTPEQAQQIINTIVTNGGGWSTTDSSDVSRKSTHRNTDGRTAACSFGSSDDVQSYRCTVTNADGSSNELSSTGGFTLSRDRDESGQETASAAALQQGSAEECSLQGWGNIGKCIAEGLAGLMATVVGGLAYVVLVIASFVLWIVGGLFNWVVIKTVFEFGSTFGTSEGMLVAWGILRDIGNIVLLFSFIFMGIATILNTHALDEYSARKALPRLIIFAVLLNFSLFAAQFVIDVSNSFAAVFTAQAGLEGCTENSDQINADTGISNRDACANNGIAGQVIQMAGVSNIWAIPSDLGEFMQNPTKQAPVYIGLAIFVTITAVVLLAAAIMLIFRAVMLCLLMVLSPIGFAGMVLPPLQEFANKWWKQLISNAFFAPIYLLLVLISLKIVDGLVGTNDGGGFAKAMIEGTTSAPQIFVIFAVVIAFMVASLMVAKQMGAAGADFATKTAGGAVLGTYGFVGRRTLGSASIAAGNAIRRNRYLTEVNPGLGRFLTKATDKGANSSYSLRNVATNLGKGAHIDFGKASKDVSHGLHGIEEKAVKDRVEYAKSFKGRSEDDTDVKNRIATAKVAQKTAAADVDAKLASENAISSTKQDAQAEVDKRETIIRKLKRDADNAAVRNGGIRDAVIEERIVAAEKDLEQKKATLAAANKELAGASKDLATARAAEAKAVADAADTSRRKITKDEQQQRYASKMEHSGLPWPSIERHANHEAAEKIKKNVNKDDLEKAIDTIKENAKKKEEKPDDHAADAHDDGHGAKGAHG